MCDECEIRDARIGELEQRNEELEDALGDAEKKLRTRPSRAGFTFPGGEVDLTMTRSPSRYRRRLVATLEISEIELAQANSKSYVSDMIGRHLAEGLIQEVRRLVASVYSNRVTEHGGGKYSVAVDARPQRFVPNIWDKSLLERIYGYQVVQSIEMVGTADRCLSVDAESEPASVHLRKWEKGDKL